MQAASPLHGGAEAAWILTVTSCFFCAVAVAIALRMDIMLVIEEVT
jgi:hypothetical protein